MWQAEKWSLQRRWVENVLSPCFPWVGCKRFGLRPSYQEEKKAPSALAGCVCRCGRVLTTGVPSESKAPRWKPRRDERLMPCVRHCLVSAQRAAQLRRENIATSCCSAAQPARSGCSTGRCSLPASQLAGFRQHNGYGTASSLPKRAHVRAAACSATQPCHRGPWQRCRAELPTASSAGVCRCTHTRTHACARALPHKGRSLLCPGTCSFAQSCPTAE